MPELSNQKKKSILDIADEIYPPVEIDKRFWFITFFTSPQNSRLSRELRSAKKTKEVLPEEVSRTLHSVLSS